MQDTASLRWETNVETILLPFFVCFGTIVLWGSGRHEEEARRKWVDSVTEMMLLQNPEGVDVSSLKAIEAPEEPDSKCEQSCIFT